MLQVVTGRENKILRIVSSPLSKVSKDTVKFIDQMIATMRKSDGVGLAAPQVGKNIRLFVMQSFDAQGKKSAVLEMINPQILWKSKEEDIETEGCLSVPGEWGKVQRPVAIKVSFMNKKSVQQKLELKGINARIAQHEYDHLDGILFVDKAIEMVSVEEAGDVRI
jgi:peptide deformylase